jgi:hypothetical protein
METALGTILVVVLSIVWPHFFWHEENPGADTRRELAKLEGCIILYKNKKNNWPPVDKWKRKIANFIAESNPGFNEVDFFSNQWGNEVNYKIDHFGQGERHILYSYGPNGKDDDGKGDDIYLTLNGESDSVTLSK